MNPLRIILCCLCLFSTVPCPAQQVLQVRDVSRFPASSLWLAGNPQAIRGRHLEMESVLDLAKPSLQDSVVEVQKQRNKALLGWTMKNILGLHWRSMDSKKQKYVGSFSREMHVFDGLAKEVDINIFIMPHLPRYVGMVRNIYKNTLEFNNGSDNQFRLDNPPFASPEELRHNAAGFFTVECEVTPPEAYRNAFNDRFMPVKVGPNPFGEDPNFGETYPAMGMMGTLCLDCNHNCRPEIHPIEWLWWLDMQPEAGAAEDWQWMVGLIHDGSGRFEDWSGSPLEGQLAVPFRVRSTASRYHLQIEPLVSGGVLEPEKVLPSLAARMESGKTEFRIGETGPVLEVEVKGLAGAEKAYWWIDGLTRDKQTGDWMGFLRLAAAAEEVFCVRVSSGPR